MPRSTQFPRSNVAGNEPDRIDAGSFAVNWKDKKLFTGGPDGAPMLLAYRVSDFDDDRAYREEDIMYREGSLWRCKVPFATGGFIASQWEELTDNTTAPYKELSGSTLISGGQLIVALNTDQPLVPAGPNQTGLLYVTGGEGVVMDATDPENPVITPVSWNSTYSVGIGRVNSTYYVGIASTGQITIEDIDDADADWFRSYLVLGVFTTDSTGAVVSARRIAIAQHTTKDTLSDFLRAVGPFKVSGVTISTSSPSQLRLSGGEVFWQGLNPLAPSAPEVGGGLPISPSPNIVTVPTINPFPVKTANRSQYVSTLQTTTLDVARWDNGGSLTNVTGSNFTTQFIFMNPDLSQGVALYGQKQYASLDSALADVPAAFEAALIPPILKEMIVVGALCSNSTGTSQGIVNSSDGVGKPFGSTGSGGSGGDTSQFLLLSGTRAMTGDLNLGGNDLINGTVDGGNVTLVPIATDVTGDTPSSEAGEIGVNVTDGKIFSQTTPVADRVDLYAADRIYAVGDKCIQANDLYRCITPVDPAEAFDAAKWQLIGASSAGDVSQAVTKAPDSPTRNQIDVTGQGGLVPALTTVFDNSQSVDLYQFSDDATISRHGVPEKAFGEHVFRVSQVNHLFTAVGTAVYFNGAVWATADTGDQARYPQAIVHRVIDTDTVLLQVGGRINNLDPAAFVGGVAPTAGQFYFGSGESGKLTAVEGTTPVPVLYAISSTQGIVKLTGTRQKTILTPTDVVDLIYPVGSIYISLDPANPEVRWPDTEWQMTAAGRAIVGVGNNGESIWAAGDERGSETHTLTEAEMPTHAHGVTDPGHFHGVTDPGHSHGPEGGGKWYTTPATGARVDNGGPSNDSEIDRTTTNTTGISIRTAGTNISIRNTGDGDAHANIQPSMGFYIWERIV